MATGDLRGQRPVFFNLLQIQLPVGALTSITHRVTGVLLVLNIPVGVYLLDLSLRSPEGYAEVIALFDKSAIKGAALVMLWALAHHLLAGIRHLLMDIGVGSKLPAARRSAWMANLGGVTIVLLAAGAMLWHAR
jgi:succinate dehydrogenase / fumarate reductase cytochrome b subunit